MNEAEMAYKRPRLQPASVDRRKREAFYKTVGDQIGNCDGNAAVVTVDQLPKGVGADLTYSWVLIDKRPSIDVSASRDGVNLSGALTEHGETLCLESNESFSKEVTVRLLQALQEKVGKNLIVVLGQAPYFIANKVKNVVADTASDLVYFPAGSPDLNPTEECWRQFRKALGNLDEVQTVIQLALESIDTSVDEYSSLCPPECRSLPPVVSRLLTFVLPRSSY